jgi:hypothetical protein
MPLPSHPQPLHLLFLEMAALITFVIHPTMHKRISAQAKY